MARGQHPHPVVINAKAQFLAATDGGMACRLGECMERTPRGGARLAPRQRHQGGGERENDKHHQHFEQRQPRAGVGQEGAHDASISEATGGSQHNRPPPSALRHFLINGLTASGTSKAVAGAPLITTLLMVITILFGPMFTSDFMGNFTPPKLL